MAGGSGVRVAVAAFWFLESMIYSLSIDSK
jgi:hypothetical protein